MQEQPNPAEATPEVGTTPVAPHEPHTLENSEPASGLTGTDKPSAAWDAYLASGFNTSGSGATAVMPGELRGFNWGAFWLTWIWSIGNGAWIGLLCLLPFIGTFMMVVLGFNGNEWAWQNRKWDSIEHFRSTQQAWAKWGVAFLVLRIAFFICIASLGAFRRGGGH